MKVRFAFVEGEMELESSKVIFVETHGHKNVFHTVNGRYSLYKKLDEIEKEFAGMGFIRTHQSFLVNMRYIEKISSYVLRLSTGVELSVPKSRYPYVKREFALYQEERGTD